MELKDWNYQEFNSLPFLLLLLIRILYSFKAIAEIKHPNLGDKAVDRNRIESTVMCAMIYCIIDIV